MTQGTGDKLLEILLVEDSPADARLAEETIKGTGHKTNITHAEDGNVALAMLRREGDHANLPQPDLILLDLKMPNKDGMEVLKEINDDPELVSIPVVILTGTEAEQSLLNSYNIPPSRYWKKPIEARRFEMAITQLDSMGREPISVSGPGSRVVTQRIETVATGAQKKKWWWPF